MAISRLSPEISNPIVIRKIQSSHIVRWSTKYQVLIYHLAKATYTLKPRFPPPPLPPHPITVVCISDTHNIQCDLPPGDLLLHAGDLTQNGSFDELQAQLDWLNRQTHPYKVVIAGNHDLLLDDTFTSGVSARVPSSSSGSGQSTQESSKLNFGRLIYLQDSSATLTFPSHNNRSLKVFGSPKSPQYGTWAFQYPPIRDVFFPPHMSVPLDIDVLLTHGPSRYHLDTTDGANGHNHSGCRSLLKLLWTLRNSPRKKLKLVCFGHIHARGGEEELVKFDAVQKLYEWLLHVVERISGSTLISMASSTSGLLLLAIFVAWAWVWHWLQMLLALEKFVTRKETKRPVKLVNAAIAGGRDGMDARKPIVVHI